NECREVLNTDDFRTLLTRYSYSVPSALTLEHYTFSTDFVRGYSSIVAPRQRQKSAYRCYLRVFLFKGYLLHSRTSATLYTSRYIRQKHQSSESETTQTKNTNKYSTYEAVPHHYL
ncbi:hypothetical protein, partial [Prevotella sp. DNF00663]|uniref:hypothetical protein n=1 Tax=Prevotella sp. DNF00663 TaxID=1384078 RepID=UPI001E3B9BDC